MEEVLLVIDNIPLLIECVIPGMLFLMMFRFLTGWHFDSQAYEIGFAVVASALLKSFSSIFAEGNARLLVSCIIAVLLSGVLGAAFRSKRFNVAFSSLFVKGLHDNLWEDVIDFKRGTVLKIFTSTGEVILGGVHGIEEKGGESWLELECFEFEENGRDEDYKVYEESGFSPSLMVRMADIKKAIVLVESPEGDSNE